MVLLAHIDELGHTDTGQTILRWQLRAPTGDVGNVSFFAVRQSSLEPLHVAGSLEAVQVKTVQTDGNNIVKQMTVSDIHTGETIFAHDTAAFTNAQKAAGLCQIGVLKTGDVLFNIICQQFALFAAFQIHAGQVTVVRGEAVAGVGEADADFIHAAVLGTTGDVGHPVQMVINGRDGSFCQRLIQMLDPLGIGAVQVTVDVSVVIHAAQDKFQGAAHGHVVALTAHFHFAAGKVYQIGITGSIHKTLAQDRLAAFLGVNDNALNGVAFHDGIHQRCNQQNINAGFLNHAVKEELVLFGVRIALPQTVHGGQTLKKLAAQAGQKVQGNIDQTHGGQTAQGRGVFDNNGLGTHASRCQSSTGTGHAAAYNDHIILAIYGDFFYGGFYFAICIL